MSSYHDKIATILRNDKYVIEDLERKLEKSTGKFGVMKSIAEKYDALLEDRLRVLGLAKTCSADDIHDALVSKIESDDLAFSKYIWASRDGGITSIKKTADLITKLHPPQEGFFLKKEKAREMLMAEPPKNILRILGYKTVEEMLKKEELEEVYSALRFLEDNKWQNEVFFKQYEKLTPDDFEKRKIELRVLSSKWADFAVKFVAKKYHNVSHLKELGIIFVIPIFLGISGETLRLASLLFHYLNEVKYYSDLFEMISEDDKFSEKLISLLRGDVVEVKPEKSLPEADHLTFLMIQRYLAKDDQNDWRLFYPHINSETIHWQKAEKEIVDMNSKIPNLNNGLDFWEDLGPVGDFFKDDGGKTLISFNLVDTVMSLVRRKEEIKYLYHQQEAMWNLIFINYFGFDNLEEMSKKYILKGWFKI